MLTTQSYQHHMQYLITHNDYSALRSRLAAAAPDATGSACIHTLLFNAYRSAALPSLDGQDEPLFALHYYDNDPTYLLLEKRLNDTRTTAMVAEAECRALLAGETGWLLDRRNPVLREFYDSLTEQMLLPRVLLTYQREFYSLDSLDLWIALDTDIRTTLQHMDFLDPETLARDTAGQEGQLRMEVSYSHTIPDYVLALLVETAPKRKPLLNA